MYELLGAFILYQCDASAGWWAAFIAILTIDFLFAGYRGYRDKQ
jgi:hypothetical protein